MHTRTIPAPTVVPREEWLAVRTALLVKEKALTRQLPWVKLDKPYVFESPDSKCALADLFGKRSQIASVTVAPSCPTTSTRRASTRPHDTYEQHPADGSACCH